MNYLVKNDVKNDVVREIDRNRVAGMTLFTRRLAILGVCSLVHHAEPRVRYGHAGTRDVLDT